MPNSIVQIKDQEYWLRVNEDGSPVDAEIKKVDVVIKEVPRQGFAITYLSSIVQMIDAIGNKKLAVVKYILEHMDSNNKLTETASEIAEHTGISRVTVSETLKLLQSAGVIARKVGVVMLSPKLAHKGNAKRERYLLTVFKELQNENAVTNDSNESDKSESV